MKPLARVPATMPQSGIRAIGKDLLIRRGVSVAPGETFGPAGRGFVRVSLATSAEPPASGIERLVEAVAERV